MKPVKDLEVKGQCSGLLCGEKSGHGAMFAALARWEGHLMETVEVFGREEVRTWTGCSEGAQMTYFRGRILLKYVVFGLMKN